MRPLRFVLTCIPLALPVPAQVPAEDDLARELRALLDTEVIVAGKKAQRISDAPAIVSVISAEDIRNLDATSIYEVLGTVPGINVTETFYGYDSVSVRGNLQANYNNKWLFLLNDHPMFEPVTGSSQLEYVPLNLIKRIEILRGPGSTVYGTNAFTGVVKVVTYGAGEKEALEGGLRAGSFHERGADARYGMTQGEFWLSVGATTDRSDGYPYDVLKDENGRAGLLHDKSDVSNGLVSMGYGSFTANFGAFSGTKGKFGLVPTLVSTGDRDLTGRFVDVAKAWTPTGALRLTWTAYWDSLHKNELIAWYPPSYALQQAGTGEPEWQTYTGTKTGSTLSGSFQVTPSWSLGSGLFWESQRSGPYVWRNAAGDLSPFKSSSWTDDHRLSNRGGYVTLNGDFGPLGVTAGARYTDNSIYGSKALPTLGLVYRATDKLTFKALYGSAYRDPSLFELYVQTANVLDGNLALKPEEVRSMELGMDFLSGGHSYRLNLFRNDSRDLIARNLLTPAGQSGNSKNTPTYGNALGQIIHGVEGEIKGSFGGGETHFINASYLTGTEKSNNSDVQFIPKWLANLGTRVPLFGRWGVTAAAQFVGRRQGTLADNSTPAATPSYALVNLGADFRGEHCRFGFGAKNLLDKTYGSPEYIRRNLAEIPGGPERSIYIQVGYHQ